MLVNDELETAFDQSKELIQEKEAQITAAREKLRKLYDALETGHLDLIDLAPRIKDLRAQIENLERAKTALAERGGQSIQTTEAEVEGYVTDLQDLLAKGSIVERKSFLRSWVKKIVMDKKDSGVIEYALPIIAMNGDSNKSNQEVLSIVKNGVANGT